MHIFFIEAFVSIEFEFTMFLGEFYSMMNFSDAAVFLAVKLVAEIIFFMMPHSDCDQLTAKMESE
jgi:hypothetical protein